MTEWRIFHTCLYTGVMMTHVNDIATIARMSEVARTLGKDSRLILMLLIAAGEKPVEMLAELSGIPVASTSQHLQVLKKAGMVVARRDGKHVLYRLPNGPVAELIDALERFAVFRGLRPGGETALADGISGKELQKKLKTGKTLLVDVRSRAEYNKGHITGALSVPFTELKKQTDKLPKGRELVVYCRGPYCLLSVNAVELLAARGIHAVRLVSGYAEWQGDRTPGPGR